MVDPLSYALVELICECVDRPAFRPDPHERTLCETDGTDEIEYLMGRGAYLMKCSQALAGRIR